MSGRPRCARWRGGRAHRLPRAAHRAARAGAAPRRRAVHLGGAADLEDRCHPERGGPGARARLSRAAGRPAPRADPRVDPRRPVEVRAAHRAAAHRAGARRPRAGETGDGRQRVFVDIAGYTRLAGRLDAATVDRLVERYFGAFLDEILRNGGDVNETAGDGLMVIFQDGDPRRHARAAVTTALALLRRAREINAAEPLDEPIVL